MALAPCLPGRKKEIGTDKNVLQIIVMASFSIVSGYPIQKENKIYMCRDQSGPLFTLLWVLLDVRPPSDYFISGFAGLTLTGQISATGHPG